MAMRNRVCCMEGGWGMAQHEFWRSLISGVVSRAAGLILVCPDKGVFYQRSVLFNVNGSVKERERHPSPSSPPKKKKKKRTKRKRRRNYPSILLPRKREKAAFSTNVLNVVQLTTFVERHWFLFFYKAIIYIILSYVTLQSIVTFYIPCYSNRIDVSYGSLIYTRACQ